MRRKSLSLRSRFESFAHATAGLKDMLLTEPNAWLHAAMTCLVFAMSWWLQIGSVKFALIVFAVIAVWVAEAFNTVLELTVDIATSKAQSEAAKRAKDIAAAAVLIASAGASLIGLLVLGSPFYRRISYFFS